MYKKMLFACLLPLCMQASETIECIIIPNTGDTHAFKQGAEPIEFVFHSPKTSGKTALLTAGAGIGTALATHYGIESLLNFLNVKEIPVKLLTTLGIPITNWLHLNFTSTQRPSLGRSVINGMVICTAGAVGALVGLLVYASQPEGNFTAARNNLAQVVDNDLLHELLNAQENLLRNIDNEYIEFTYPRVAAYADFIRFHTSLKQAAQWLKEAISATHDDTLITRAEEYMDLITNYMQEINMCVQIIRNEPDWLKQLKGNELQKTREAQERLAFATQMAALNNHYYVTNI